LNTQVWLKKEIIALDCRRGQEKRRRKARAVVVIGSLCSFYVRMNIYSKHFQKIFCVFFPPQVPISSFSRIFFRRPSRNDADVCHRLRQVPALSPHPPSSSRSHFEMYISCARTPPSPPPSEGSCESDNCFNFLIVETHTKAFRDCAARCATASAGTICISICGLCRVAACY